MDIALIPSLNIPSLFVAKDTNVMHRMLLTFIPNPPALFPPPGKKLIRIEGLQTKVPVHSPHRLPPPPRLNNPYALPPPLPLPPPSPNPHRILLLTKSPSLPRSPFLSPSRPLPLPLSLSRPLSKPLTRSHSTSTLFFKARRLERERERDEMEEDDEDEDEEEEE